MSLRIHRISLNLDYLSVSSYYLARHGLSHGNLWQNWENKLLFLWLEDQKGELWES